MSAPKATNPAVTHAALRYLKHAADWVSNKEIASHCGIATQHVSHYLSPSQREGLIETCSMRQRTFWRLRPPAPVFSIGWPPGFASSWGRKS